jgi:hypothetical protein
MKKAIDGEPRTLLLTDKQDAWFMNLPAADSGRLFLVDQRSGGGVSRRTDHGLDPQLGGRSGSGARHKSAAKLSLTTHLMEEAERLRRVAIIEHGRIIDIDMRSGSSTGTARSAPSFSTGQPDR